MRRGGVVGKLVDGTKVPGSGRRLTFKENCAQSETINATDANNAMMLHVFTTKLKFLSDQY
jgi:hypothetical protein